MIKDFYYQATELDWDGKPVGSFNFDGYVKAEDHKTALKLARKIVYKANAWHKKTYKNSSINDGTFNEWINDNPTKFKITYLDTEEPR